MHFLEAEDLDYPNCSLMSQPKFKRSKQKKNPLNSCARFVHGITIWTVSAMKGLFEQLRSTRSTTYLNSYIQLKQKFLTQNSWQQLSFSLSICSCSHFKLPGL